MGHAPKQTSRRATTGSNFTLACRKRKGRLVAAQRADHSFGLRVVRELFVKCLRNVCASLSSRRFGPTECVWRLRNSGRPAAAARRRFVRNQRKQPQLGHSPQRRTLGAVGERPRIADKCRTAVRKTRVTWAKCGRSPRLARASTAGKKLCREPAPAGEQHGQPGGPQRSARAATARYSAAGTVLTKPSAWAIAPLALGTLTDRQCNPPPLRIIPLTSIRSMRQPGSRRA